MYCRSALAAALILVLDGGKLAGAAPVRIAYSSISGAMLPLWVAKDKGLFDKYGVEAELMYIRDDPEILSEVYRIYGINHLQKNLSIDLEGVKGLLNGLGSEAAQIDPAAFMDVSLLQDLDREGFFQAKNR